VQLDAVALVPGTVVAVEVDGHEYVIWRGRTGALGSAPRSCPHLDHDLAEGYVIDDELVCPGHAWAFDGRGQAFKRNEFGRVDPKGAVPTLRLTEEAACVRVESVGS
jgi:phenylpropionate dioxygenase-like ring-hydroxylating dioxygenase large terminal subunit